MADSADPPQLPAWALMVTFLRDLPPPPRPAPPAPPRRPAPMDCGPVLAALTARGTATSAAIADDLGMKRYNVLGRLNALVAQGRATKLSKNVWALPQSAVDPWRGTGPRAAQIDACDASAASTGAT